MASPQGGYPPQQGYPPQDGYAQQDPQYQQEGYAGNPASSPPPDSYTPVPGAAAGRKKRAYAGQAYEFGAGPNSALGGQQQAGAQLGGYGQPQPVQQQQPAYGAAGYDQPQPQAAQGYPDPAAAVGGYQAPGPAYPAAGGVNQLNQQMGAMGISDRPGQAPLARGATTLNQLYPTDLLNNPLNVAELDFPPPPIILPPNVSQS